MSWRPAALGVLVGLALCPSAWGDEWRVDASAGTIGFIATYDEIPFEGRFRDFEAHISFNPGRPDGGSFEATIDVASVDTDSPDRDEGMLEADWFDVDRFPQAVFTSTGVERLAGENEFALNGDLTIKGVMRALRLVFTWTESAGSARMMGSADVRRGDFDIGSGDWAEDDTIGFDVRIVVDLTFTP